jgi:hypothetical protein
MRVLITPGFAVEIGFFGLGEEKESLPWLPDKNSLKPHNFTGKTPLSHIKNIATMVTSF